MPRFTLKRRRHKMAVINMNLYSAALGMKTDVMVILPFYSVDDVVSGKREDIFPIGKKYQVLWLLHGGNGNDCDYVNYTNIVRYANDHMLAVVMPTGYNMNTDDFEVGMKMCTYVGEELPNTLRNIFPLSDKREDNFIGGLSMGSNGAQKVAIRYPENYAAVLAMSAGSFSVRPKVEGAPKRSFNTGMPMPPHKENEMEENCEILLKDISDGKLLPKFFMIWGEKDIAREGQTKSTKFLQDNGCDVWWEEVPGLGHERDLWDRTLKKAFNELLPLKHDLID
jgi:enterochelin esterase-like enzyme